MSEKTHELALEERLLAAIAHGSVITQGMGIAVGILVYITQRDKSKFAAFQALQAAAYQLITLIFVIGMWMCWGVFYTLSFIPLMDLPENAPPPPIFWIGMGSMIIPLIIMVILGAIGLWASIRTLQGKDFRYPVIGPMLERSGLWNDKK